AAADVGRPEIDEAKAGLAARAVEVRAARDETRPRVDAYASYARRGLAGSLGPDATPVLGVPLSVPTDLSGGLGRSLGTIGDGLYPDFRVGVSVTVPLGNRAARAAAAISEAEHRR